MQDGQHHPLVLLISTLASLSLLAVGGGNSVLPEMHRQFVDHAGWFSDGEFARMYALAQTAPGPNIMVVALFGWHAASYAGAALAPLALCLPSSVLTLVIGRLWHRFRESAWRNRIAAALMPVSVGLILASGLVLAQDQDNSWVALALTLSTTAVTVFTKFNPLWCLGSAGLIGVVSSL